MFLGLEIVRYKAIPLYRLFICPADSGFRFGAWLPVCGFVFLLLLGACGASRPPVTTPGESTPHASLLVAGKTLQQIWLAALPAMTIDLNITQLDQTQGIIRGNRPQWSMGEEVLVAITALPAGEFRIDVVTTRTDTGSPPWDVVILDRIRSGLDNRGGNLRNLAQ